MPESSARRNGTRVAGVKPLVRDRPPARDAGRFPARFSWTLVGIASGFALVVTYGWLWAVGTSDVGAGLVLVPLLVLLSGPMFVRAARTEARFDLAGLLLVGLVARFAGAYYRFTHAVDAQNYHAHGVRISDQLLDFDFGPDAGGGVPGTGGLNLVSGVVHVFTGNDMFGSFLLMAWLGFVGCWLLYRAFTLAVPDGNHRRYAVLLMLWPAMVFWPSSLGKEAWLVFTMGVTAYGAARVFVRVRGGYTLLFVGLVGASFVRPHMALLAALAFAVALLLGRLSSAARAATPSGVAKIAGVLLLVVLGTVLVSQTQKLLDLDDFRPSTVINAIDDVRGRTDEGGSTFDAPDPLSPTGFPAAVVTTLFRPFPVEASGMEQVVTALEGLLLIGLTLISLDRFLVALRWMRPHPYVGYVVVYVLLWILVFGVISNFGILVRQRTQMMPMYFALLSLPGLASITTRARPGARAGPGAPRPSIRGRS